MGVLSLAVPGTVGFGIPDPMSNAPNEPGQILVLLNVGAIFMGTALTIRDLIGERAIFRREQAVGLSTTAYLLAKVCVYTVFAVVHGSQPRFIISCETSVLYLSMSGTAKENPISAGRPLS